MNIAVPIYGERVMPRFGLTREIIIAAVTNGNIASEKRLTLTAESFMVLPKTLHVEQVSIVICGGIHPRFQQAIERQHIQVIWGVIGVWRDVVQAYLGGTLQTDPAFCLHRHGHRRGFRFRQGPQHRRI
ncbi:MAG: NifB/NifX family molybdenum-iron cluster-binding protein [Candidatus Vecturithrix sp.]|jgi:predicted Fe-Mo cluster-binding NifX family protein|nr:NifB/NifX family molybdenum-iron cluster-binding protein [Candidatus Vecturithrix sp.]